MHSDKFQHGIVDVYKRHLFPWLQDSPDLRIVELGVWNGGSLEWLTRVYPLATVIGVDLIRYASVDPALDVRIIDQSDRDRLTAFATVEGPFDVVIDDASHVAVNTMRSFEALWPHVKPGGWYCIEDWIAAYWPEHPEYSGLADVVLDIAKNKNLYCISDINLILKDPKCSVAMYRKGNL